MDAQVNVDVGMARRDVMHSGFRLPAVAAGLMLIGWASVLGQAEEPAKAFDEQFRPFLASHCVSCHSGEKPKGKLSLDPAKLDFADAAARKQWTAVVKRLQAGE